MRGGGARESRACAQQNCSDGTPNLNESDSRRIIHEKRMDWRETLRRLTALTNESDVAALLDEILPAPDRGSDLRSRYVEALAFALKKWAEGNEDEASVSVGELRVARRAVDLIFLLGVAANLLPGVGVEASRIFPSLVAVTSMLDSAERSESQKQQLLEHSLRSLLDLFQSPLLRPSLLNRLNLLLPGLLQCSFAPPQDDGRRAEFKGLLSDLVQRCPRVTLTRELMVILGQPLSPEWLRLAVRRLLVGLLTDANGVRNLFAACIEEPSDVDWGKLEAIGRLVVANHTRRADYHPNICRQLLDALTCASYSTAAVACVCQLYEADPCTCRQQIVDQLTSPLRRASTRLSIHVDALHAVFASPGHALPSGELSPVAKQLFSIHLKLQRSPLAWRRKAAELATVGLRGLDSFGVLLGLDRSQGFGHWLETEFDCDGDLAIASVVENDEQVDVQSAMRAIGELLVGQQDGETLNRFFCYLLRLLASEASVASDVQAFEKSLVARLAAVQTLSQLSSERSVAKFQLANPGHVIGLIRSLLVNRSAGDEEMLCVCLTMATEMLQASEATEAGEFRQLAECLKEDEARLRSSTRLKKLAKRFVESVESFGRGKKGGRYLEDLSADDEIEEAFRDLGDPLLPVRAHGIVRLTRMLENRQPEAVQRGELILRMFLENLNDDDSFVYLAAINGLCSLATLFPSVVIQPLILEYVRMPERVSQGEVSVENRCKLGEILVKTTRSLGEMASAHKDLLLNGFLHATRDADATIRASSLSCLAELCKTLNFRLGNAVTEILHCVSSIVETDRSAECRRAAVLVAASFLRGFESFGDAVGCLGEDAARLHRALKRLRDRDDDSVVRLHAQLALQEFDRVTREFLFAPAKIEKKISI